MRNTKLALWSLANRPDCRIEGDKLYDGDEVIFVGVRGLMVDGYLDTRGVITEVGRRIANRPLSSASVAAAMRDLKSASRYVLIRLLHDGLIEETPGGALQRTQLRTATIRVTNDQLLLLQMMQIKVVSVH